MVPTETSWVGTPLPEAQEQPGGRWRLSSPDEWALGQSCKSTPLLGDQTPAVPSHSLVGAREAWSSVACVIMDRPISSVTQGWAR